MSVGTAAMAEAASIRFCEVVLAASKMPTFSVHWGPDRGSDLWYL